MPDSYGRLNFPGLQEVPTNQYFVLIQVGPSVFVTSTTYDSMDLDYIVVTSLIMAFATFSVLSIQFYVSREKKFNIFIYRKKNLNYFGNTI